MSKELQRQMIRLAEDKELRVRFRVALVLAELESDQATTALIQI